MRAVIYESFIIFFFANVFSFLCFNLGLISGLNKISFFINVVYSLKESL